MWNEIFKIAISNGIFAVLFVSLLFYVLKDSRSRETKYQETIMELNSNLKVVEDIKSNVNEIKDEVNEIEDDVKIIKHNVCELKSDVAELKTSVSTIKASRKRVKDYETKTKNENL